MKRERKEYSKIHTDLLDYFFEENEKKSDLIISRQRSYYETKSIYLNDELGRRNAIFVGMLAVFWLKA